MKGPLQALEAWIRLARAETLAWPWQMAGRYVLFVSALYLLVRAEPLVRPGMPDPELDFLPWMLVGVAALDLAVTGLLGAPWRLRQLQREGMLEPCLLSRVPMMTQLLVLGAPSGLHGLVRAGALTLVAAALAGVLGEPAVLIALGAVLLLIWLVHTLMGLVSTALVLRIGALDLLGPGVALLSLVACGALLPRALVGQWVGALGAWLPLTPGVQLLRDALVAQEALSVSALVQLVGTGLLLLPVALFALSRGLERMRTR